MRKIKLAVINTHPIQYFTPLYGRLAQEKDIDLMVYFCSRQGLNAVYDEGFGAEVKWDVPLLQGYNHTFLPPLTTDRGVGGFFSLVNPSVIRELVKGQFDAVWIHGYSAFTLMLVPLVSKFLKTKVMIRGETHNDLRRDARHWRKHRFLMKSAVLPFVDVYLAIGSRNRAYYHSLGIPEKKVFQVPYTIDNRRFGVSTSKNEGRKEIQKLISNSEHKRFILYCSKFVDRKKPCDAINAFKMIADKYPDTALVMIGDGPLMEQVSSAAGQCLEKSIFLPGFVNQQRLPSLYRGADFFVFPSVNEPWGLVINEVMAAGCPVIASEEIGATPDLIEHKKHGLVFPAENISALAGAMQHLLEAENLSDFSRNAKERMQTWSYEECIHGIRAALNFAVPEAFL